MNHVNRLLQLLNPTAFQPGFLFEIRTVCDQWFRDTPKDASLAVRGVFFEIIHRWDDPDAIDTATFESFRDGVLPSVRAVLKAEPAGDPSLIDALAVDFATYLGLP